MIATQSARTFLRRRSRPRVAFVTNFCPHYRIRTFELLSRECDVDFFFFSRGQEWYWSGVSDPSGGRFRFEYLRGVSVLGTRICPDLVSRLRATEYDVYIKCINGRFALPATYWTARQTGRPLILWTGIWHELQTLAHRLTRSVTHRIYRGADAIVTYGDHVRRFLLGVGVQADRIFVAPHAIDNEFYSRLVAEEEKQALRRDLGIDPTRPIILYVGRLVRSKGLEYLLDAVAKLAQPRPLLIIVGDGEARQRIDDRARALAIGADVRVIGNVSPERTVVLYALSTMLVIPSITTDQGKEPWGLVVNEAFNQGLPVVASRAVGAAAGGLVDDGRSGLIVPERDSGALSAAIASLLRDGEFARRLGAGGRAAMRDWDNRGMVEGFTRAIDYVIAAQRTTA